MKKNLIFLFILFLQSIGAWAQDTNVIKARVTDAESQTPLGNVVLILLNTKQEVLKVGVTDPQGNFLFNQVPPDSVKLIARFIGYQEIIKEINTWQQAPDTKNVYIQLRLNPVLLSQVEITAKRNAISFEDEKLVIRKDYFKHAAGSGLEVLNIIPGVVVENETALTLNGNGNVTILINDRKVSLTTQQALTYIKNLPTDAIEKIEIINIKNAKYEASGGAGIINIVTNKNISDGYQLSLNNGISYNRYWRNSHHVNFNFKKNRLQLLSSLGYSRNNGFSSSSSSATFIENDTRSTQLMTNSNSNRDTWSVPFSVALDYELSSSSQLGFTSNSYHERISASSQGRTNVMHLNGLEEEPGYEIMLVKNEPNQEVINTTSLDYSLKLDSAGSKFKVVAGRISGFSRQRLIQDYAYRTQERTQEVGVRAHLPLDGHQYFAQADLTKRLSSKLKVEAGARMTMGEIKNNVEYDSLLNNQLRHDAVNSRNLEYTEKITSAYALVNLYASDKVSVQSGLRYEYTMMKNYFPEQKDSYPRTFHNFFPSFNINYNTPNLKSSLGFNRSINRPNFQYINSYTRVVDRFNVQEGNSYLNPAFSYNYVLNTSLFGFAYINLGYSYTKDEVFQFTQTQQANLINIIRPENALNYKVIFLALGATYQVTSKWTGQLNGSGNQLKYLIKPDFYTSELDLDWRQLFNINLTNTYNITNAFSISSSVFYYSDRRFFQARMEERWQSNLSVSKSFRNNMRLSLYATDIFNTNKFTSESYTRNYRSFGTMDPSSTRVNLNLIININKNKELKLKKDKQIEMDINRFKSS